MNEINEMLLDYMIFIIPSLILIIIILLIIIIVMGAKQKKFRKRLEKFLGSTNERHNIEAMLNSYLHQVKSIDEKHDVILNSIDDINNRMFHCIQKVGLIRYNPFDDVGGDLSYALALLNENNDGFVINNIFARDSSYTYAKPIKDGKCATIKLSDEEEQAISLAVKNNNALN